MRGLKTLFGSTALLAGLGLSLAMAPAANAQVVVNLGIQPVCSYGYYDYAPYACSPMGYYGPGYFYNGIFLGMGPWANWGYGHGWGGHRFAGGGGGSYRGGGGAYRASGGGGAYRGGGGSHIAAARGGTTRVAASRPSAAHAAVSHGGASHAAASHGGGGGHASGGGGHASGGGRR